MMGMPYYYEDKQIHEAADDLYSWVLRCESNKISRLKVVEALSGQLYNLIQEDRCMREKMEGNK
jgi:hypothetical protein